MARSLTGQRHSHRSRRGGKAKAIIKTVSYRCQTAGCPLVQVTAPCKGVSAGATTRVGVSNCKAEESIIG